MKLQPRYKPGERIGGRYQVYKALMGGMGEVYLCLDLETNYPYALKTFQQRYQTDTQRLRCAFEQEVATWVALEKHPNIVRCFWMQILDNQPFMALEWIAGEEGKGSDLRSWLRHGPLDLKLALQIAIDICNGLIYARSKQPGLVHRDLKPENILMAQGGLAKITDFGLAEIVQTAELELDQASTANSPHSLVRQHGIAGTPAYMAPEQWRGEALNERTDIYALGCILYELLTGSPPFVVDFAPTTAQQFKSWLQIMQSAHETQLAQQLPTSFASSIHDLLAISLAKSTQDRPTDLNELMRQLTTTYHLQFGESPPGRPKPGIFTATDYNNRGVTYAAVQQRTAALMDYDRAIELNPNNVNAYSNRSLIYRAFQQYETALANVARAIALHPSFAEAYSNRGVIYADLQQYDLALTCLDRAIEIDSSISALYVNRGNIYGALKKDTEALTDFSRAIDLDSQNAQAFYNRGVTHMALKDDKAALSDFHRAIELVPDDLQAYNDRGLAYQNLGVHTKALADFNHAISLNPNHAKAYYNRSLSYSAMELDSEALADIHHAIALDPNNANAHYQLGALLVNQDQLHQGLAHLETAVDLGYIDGKQAVIQVRQKLGLETTPNIPHSQQAFDAFRYARSIDEMLQVTQRFLILLEPNFIKIIEQTIAIQSSAKQRPAFELRLAWLKQIVAQQSYQEQTP